MLPPQLLGTYRQYKQDTDSVASWLASTAIARGYPADLLATAPKTSGRLKGKARTKARSGGASNPKPANEKRHIIAIKDFVPLANFIAGRRVPVPGVFSTTIDRLIALRSGFGDKLGETGAKPDPESDQKHGYFVGILEAVRKALRPRMVPTTAAVGLDAVTEASKDTSSDPAQDLGGRFAALTVDEPSESFLDNSRNASHERPKPAQDDAASYEAEQPTSLEDIFFAFETLMKDLHPIRARIRLIWSRHSDGDFDLAAAAVATNTAVSLARGLIEEMEPIIAKYEAGFKGLLRICFASACMSKGMTTAQLWSDGVVTDRQDANYDCYDAANRYYFIPLRTFEKLLHELIPNSFLVMGDGRNGEYDDATSSWASLTNQQKCEQDRIILAQHVTDLLAVALRAPKFEFEDEFLRGMRILKKELKVSFPLIFAAQVFLDIHHELGAPAARRVFATMTEEVRTMDESLAGHLELHQDIKHRHWTPEWDKGLHDLRRSIALNAKDPAHQAKVKLFKEAGQNILPPNKEKNRIWILSPVLSGLYLLTVRVQVYHLGLKFANTWQSIMHCAHLYNLLDGLEGTWVDMNMAIFLLGESNLWVGEGRPKTIDDCFEKFYLQNGNTAAAFARNRQGNRTAASRARVRMIEPTVPVSTIFAKAQIGIGTEIVWTSELIEDIVGRSTYTEKATLDGEVPSLVKIRDQ